MDIITSLRNRLYDQGLKPSASFDIPVISVGNLSVGGTGKTPMIEHLIRILKSDYAMATLSRGYKRKTKGFRIAGPSDTATTLGDEPFQFYAKYGNDVVVSVGEERAMAIPQIIHEHPQVHVILLDDAFQHRRVKPSFQILLTDFHKPFYSDFLLPAGRLRESKSGANRADVIVVTKCPETILPDEMMVMETAIRKYADRPIFFTSIHYGELIPLSNKPMTDKRIILVTGIANAESIHSHVSANYSLLQHFDFPDHHTYSAKEVKEIYDFAKENRAAVITTEKDAAKIRSEHFRVWVSETPFFYLPIEIEFLKNGQDFDAMVLNAVNVAKDA
jgi:tetraacyldisaccharide 4'-kinase